MIKPLLPELPGSFLLVTLMNNAPDEGVRLNCKSATFSLTMSFHRQ